MIDFSAVTPKLPVDHSYILLYLHSQISNSSKGAIVAYAKKRKLQIVAMNSPLRFADKNIFCGPDQFIARILNADLVVTDAFHGCIFAAKNDRPTVLVRNGTKSNKIDDFLQIVGLTDVWRPKSEITLADLDGASAPPRAD